MDGADLALGFTYRAFDEGVELPANLVFVGPARPSTTAPPWRRKAPGKPLVIASLSSGLQGDPNQYIARLQRICDALAGLDVEAVVTSGRGVDPATIAAGKNTTVVNLVPHDAVLPQAALLITHGGHGTVMAGVRYAVPMLCLAPLADQPANAARVAALGLGVALDPEASADAIGEGVRQLLGDPSFKARAAAFAAETSKEAGLEKAVEMIEALVAG
jgi:MGT family glycosyltransferase